MTRFEMKGTGRVTMNLWHSSGSRRTAAVLLGWALLWSAQSTAQTSSSKSTPTQEGGSRTSSQAGTKPASTPAAKAPQKLRLEHAGTQYEDFTFTDYNLAAQITPEKGQMEVRGKVSLRNDSATPQTMVRLQLSSTLHWDLIRRDDNALNFTVEQVESDIDHTGILNVASVTLTRPLPPGAETEIELRYSGIIPQNTTRLLRIGVPSRVALHNDWDHIAADFSGVRGVGFVVWYPVGIEPATLFEGNRVFSSLEKWKSREAEARMRISFILNVAGTGPRSPTPAIFSNGLRGESHGGVSDYSFEPLGYTVPAFVIGNYSEVSHPFGAVRYLPRSLLAATDYASAAGRLLPFVSEWFGVQRRKLEIIELADGEAAPFESGAVLFTPLRRTDSQSLDLMLVHSLTHTFVESSRPWIYEGVAHFAQALLREQQKDRKAALDYMNLRRPALALAEPEPPANPVPASVGQARGSSDDTSGSLVRSSSEVYYRTKAMFVWWMLRDMLGDSVLKHAIQSYESDLSAKLDRQPSDMQHRLETESKRSLEWFFDDWVYRDRGLPDFHVVSVSTRPILGGLIMVTANIENLGAAAAEVPVIVRGEGREVSARLLVKAHERAVSRIEVQGASGEASETSSEVQVNDGSVPESDISNNIAAIPRGRDH